MHTIPRTRRQRLVAALLVGAGLLASIVLTGTTAHAADIDIPPAYGTYVGPLHVEPSSGGWDDKLSRVWTDSAFDAAVTPQTHPVVWLSLQKGNQNSTLANLNSNAAYTGPFDGPYNFGSSSAATGGAIAIRPFSARLTNVTAIDVTAAGSTFSVILTAKTTSGSPSPGYTPYFRADFEVTATGWKLVDTAPVVKTDTVTTLGATALNTGAVRLTATVSPAAELGTVTFKDATGAELAQVTPVRGIATWTSPPLSPVTEYTYSAAYSGSDLYNPSTAAAVKVTTVSDPIAPANTNITVAIPTAAIALKFTITPGGVSLNKAAREGDTLIATGQLARVTVADQRRIRTAWTLNGRATDFVNTEDASKTIAASGLGWVPAFIGQAGDFGGTPGVAVEAGTNGGLSSAKPLAQAAAGVTNAQTIVNANIILKAPVDTTPGTYSSTLTLTLI